MALYGGETPVAVSTYFTKDTHYKNQREYRVAWCPWPYEEKVRILKIGSLRDICDVVTHKQVASGEVREYILPWTNSTNRPRRIDL